MTKISRIIAGFAAASLAVSPVVASAADRAVAPVSGESQLGDESGGWIAILGVIAVVALAIVAATNDDDSSPVSP